MPRAASYHRRAFSDRLDRAETQGVLLLHRSDPTTFHILGSTHNVYKVTLSTTPSCSCPDPFTPCKHILFVLVRLLNVPRHNPLLRRTTLTPDEVDYLHSLPVEECGTIAGDRLRYAFYEGWGRRRNEGTSVVGEAGRGDCVVCFEAVERGERVVRCGKCGNELHDKCFENWRRCQRRRAVTCVFCRAVCPVETREGEYLNLGAFVDHVEDDDDDDDGGEGEGENEVGDRGYDEYEDDEYVFEDGDEDDIGDCHD